MASALANLLKQPFIVRRLNGWRQVDEDEKWAVEGIKTLVKKLQPEMVKELERALRDQDETTECITIERSLDGRLQVCHRKGVPHVTYCKIFRWSDLQTHYELETIASCKHGFDRKGTKLICVNPYHYKRVDAPVLPPILVQRVPNRIQNPYIAKPSYCQEPLVSGVADQIFAAIEQQNEQQQNEQQQDYDDEQQQNEQQSSSTGQLEQASGRPTVDYAAPPDLIPGHFIEQAAAATAQPYYHQEPPADSPLSIEGENDSAQYPPPFTDCASTHEPSTESAGNGYYDQQSDHQLPQSFGLEQPHLQQLSPTINQLSPDIEQQSYHRLPFESFQPLEPANQQLSAPTINEIGLSLDIDQLEPTIRMGHYPMEEEIPNGHVPQVPGDLLLEPAQIFDQLALDSLIPPLQAGPSQARYYPPLPPLRPPLPPPPPPPPLPPLPPLPPCGSVNHMSPYLPPSLHPVLVSGRPPPPLHPVVISGGCSSSSLSLQQPSASGGPLPPLVSARPPPPLYPVVISGSSQQPSASGGPPPPQAPVLFEPIPEVMPLSYQDTPNSCTIQYHEHTEPLGNPFVAPSYLRNVIVNGSLNVTDSKNGHYCLGSITSIGCNEDIGLVKKKILNGITLAFFNREVAVANYSQVPVFVYSKIANLEHLLPEANVTKVPENSYVKIFNINFFRYLLDKSQNDGIEKARKLTELCQMQLSFGKGWGEGYNRQTVNNTPCWINIILQAPLKWLDEVLRMMEPTQSVCGSNT